MTPRGLIPRERRGKRGNQRHQCERNSHSLSDLCDTGRSMMLTHKKLASRAAGFGFVICLSVLVGLLVSTATAVE